MAGADTYVVDAHFARVLKVDGAGLLTTFFAARSASRAPVSIALDAAGNAYVSTLNSRSIYLVRTAASGSLPATETTSSAFVQLDLADSSGLCADAVRGVLYIVQPAAGLVLSVPLASAGAAGAVGVAAPTATVIAGARGVLVSAGDGGPASAATLNAPSACAVDAAGSLHVAEATRVRRINFAASALVAGTQVALITTVAGLDAGGDAGDGGLAINAALSAIRGLAVDSTDGRSLFVAAAGRLRHINMRTGLISGVGLGDASAPLLASFTAGLAVSARGALVVADAAGGRVRLLALSCLNAGGAGAGALPQPWPALGPPAAAWAGAGAPAPAGMCAAPWTRRPLVRFVRVTVPSSPLGLAEVRVLDAGGNNLALGQPVTASFGFANYDGNGDCRNGAHPPSNANDGQSCSYAVAPGLGSGQWWEVDLGAEADIARVTVEVPWRYVSLPAQGGWQWSYCCADGATVAFFDGTRSLVTSTTLPGDRQPLYTAAPGLDTLPPVPGAVRLTLAWQADAGVLLGAATGLAPPSPSQLVAEPLQTPVVTGAGLALFAFGGRLFALDAATGAANWSAAPAPELASRFPLSAPLPGLLLGMTTAADSAGGEASAVALDFATLQTHLKVASGLPAGTPGLSETLAAFANVPRAGGGAP